MNHQCRCQSQMVSRLELRGNLRPHWSHPDRRRGEAGWMCIRTAAPIVNGENRNVEGEVPSETLTSEGWWKGRCRVRHLQAKGRGGLNNQRDTSEQTSECSKRAAGAVPTTGFEHSKEYIICGTFVLQNGIAPRCCSWRTSPAVCCDGLFTCLPRPIVESVPSSK